MPSIRNILFICSRNKWRSPTAENIYRRHSHLAVRSRGTSKKAVCHVSEKDVRWADLIIVMERKHSRRLRNEYPSAFRSKTIHSLNIPDDYQFMDPELVSRLRKEIDPIIETQSSQLTT